VIPEKLRGTAYGLFSTSLGLISLPAPWLGARLWESVSPIFPFYIPLVAMVLMLPVMWFKFKPPYTSDDNDKISGETVSLTNAQVPAD